MSKDPNDSDETKPDATDDSTLFMDFGSDPGEVTLPIDGPSSRATLDDAGQVAAADHGLPTRFHVLDELGRGGMGVVLGAFDGTIRREVAIKLMSDDGGGSRATARFLSEAQIQGQLEHPGICPVHEVGVDNSGNPWFAMKKVRGDSLREILRQVESGAPDAPSVARLVGMFARVCEAVAFAHARGVVHRDLKPDNIMVGAFGEVHVMDWGLARVLKDSEDTGRVATIRDNDDAFASIEGSVIGTPAYMSPEQARGDLDSVDERSDLYSLGAILYQLLTLTPPFRATSPRQVLEMVQHDPLDPPSARRPGVPAELEAVVTKALSKDPNDRYPTVTALLGEVDAWREGRLVSVVQYSHLQRVSKWMRRHPAASLSLVAALIAAISVASVFQWRRVTERRERHQQAITAHGAETLLLRNDFEAASQMLADLLGPGAPALREPNGEPAAALRPWYQAHARAADATDTLLAHAETAPPGAGSDVDIVALTNLKFEIVRRAALKAVGFGDEAYAESWARRLPQPATILMEEIAAVGKARLASSLSRIDDLLAIATDVGRMSEDYFETAVLEIVRRKEPALVRHLLSPSLLDSQHEWVRRICIEALGRIGDTRTRGQDGDDPVDALIVRLEKADTEARFSETVAIARALGLLGDERAHEPLYKKRWAAGCTSVFWDRTRPAMERVPVPESVRNQLGSSDDQVSKGLRLYAAGDYAGAVGAYTEAMRLDPTNDDAWVNRGICHLLLNNPAQAVTDHTEAMKIDPKNPNAPYNRGNAHVTMRRYEDAGSDFTKAISLRAEFAEAWDGLGRATELLGDHTTAIDHYTTAIKHDPKFATAYNNRGVCRHRSGDFKGAIEDYTAALELRPERTRAWVNRGGSRASLGDLDGAISDYDEALKRNPKDLMAWNNRALVHHSKGQFDRAIEDFQKAIALAPRVVSSHVNLGRSRRAAGDLDGAVADWKNAAKFAPRNGEIPYLLACVYSQQAEDLEDLERDARFELAKAALLRAQTLGHTQLAGPDLAPLRRWMRRR